MKKSLIATAGVAAFAVAAIPFVGAFAETESTFTDTLNLTIEGGCTFKSSTLGDYARIFTASVAAGQEADFGMDSSAEPTMSVVCNTTTGKWQVAAIGGSNGAAETGVTTLNGNNSETPAIATGTTFSGDTSAWAFKIDSTGALTDSTDYSNWAQVPSTLTPVAKGNASAAKTTTGVEFTPAYHVYASPSQQVGTYTGNVSYVVSNPAT